MNSPSRSSTRCSKVGTRGSSDPPLPEDAAASSLALPDPGWRRVDACRRDATKAVAGQLRIMSRNIRCWPGERPTNERQVPVKAIQMRAAQTPREGAWPPFREAALIGRRAYCPREGVRNAAAWAVRIVTEPARPLERSGTPRTKGPTRLRPARYGRGSPPRRRFYGVVLWSPLESSATGLNRRQSRLRRPRRGDNPRETLDSAGSAAEPRI